MNLALQANLKKLMIRHGNISVSDLAKVTGLPQPTLYQLYTGVTTNPRKKTLEALACYFSVTINQLTGKDALPQHLPQKLKEQLELNTAPLLTLEDLYHWPSKIDFNHKEEIFLEKKTTHATFAIQMIGTSMEPIFPEGCLLIFDAEKATKHNDCAIIFEQATKQFVFKKILSDENSIHTKFINPAPNNTEITPLGEQDKIIATLLEARLTF